MCSTHRPVSAAAAESCSSVGLSASEWSFLRTASCHSFAMVGRLLGVRMSDIVVVNMQSRTGGAQQVRTEAGQAVGSQCALVLPTCPPAPTLLPRPQPCTVQTPVRVSYCSQTPMSPRSTPLTTKMSARSPTPCQASPNHLSPRFPLLSCFCISCPLISGSAPYMCPISVVLHSHTASLDLSSLQLSLPSAVRFGFF